jgi:hypothetical protein
MKYAAETLGLLSPYPGRKFRMREIVNYIAGRHATDKEKKQVRIGVWRVLKMLEESGHIEVETQEGRGASALYAWRSSFRNEEKVLHADQQSTTESTTLVAG